MPLECIPSSHVYSARWLPAPSSALPPWWTSLNKCAAASDRADPVSSLFSSSRLGGGSGTRGRTRRGSNPGCMFSLDLLLSTASIMVMEKWRRSQGKMDTAVGVREHTRRWISRGCGALLGCCLVSDDPPYSQVEGRPSSFLPAKMPKGRQSCLTVESMTWSHGGLVGPSGTVPGAGEAESIGVQIVRTRLQSSSLVQGLVCIMQDLVRSFLFPWGPVVKCTIMLING
ncbi:hypothetical protein VPH35_108126 [Triticum aestivum]